MATVRMSEAELARDLHAVLARVRSGAEVIVEQDDSPVAVIKPPPAGRKISDIIADLKARGAGAVMDDGFARDIEEGIRAHREPWDPPSRE